MNTGSEISNYVDDTASKFVSDPTIPNRLITLLSRPEVTFNDKRFYDSLKDTYLRYKQLTHKQYLSLLKAEERYNPSEIAKRDSEREAWIASFDEEKKKILKICARYYSYTEYFNDIAVRCVREENYIPSEKQYRAMCENKYAKRLVENMTTIKFPVGSVVELRAGKNSEPVVGSVCEVLDKITRQSANIGSRQYRVMWMNNGEETIVVEKMIKIYRRK